MKVKVIKSRTNKQDFSQIIRKGNVFNVLSETEDGKGYYVALLVGACRVEKDEVQEV